MQAVQVQCSLANCSDCSLVLHAINVNSLYRMQLCSISFRKLFHDLMRLVMGHFAALFCEFDPIKDASKASASIHTGNYFLAGSINPNFLLPLGLVLFFYTDSFIALYSNRLKFDYDSIQLYTHSILPREFWFHGDVMIHVGMAMQVAIYSNLLFQPLLNRRYCMLARRTPDNRTVQIVDSKGGKDGHGLDQ